LKQGQLSFLSNFFEIIILYDKERFFFNIFSTPRVPKEKKNQDVSK